MADVGPPPRTCCPMHRGDKIVHYTYFAAAVVVFTIWLFGIPVLAYAEQPLQVYYIAAILLCALYIGCVMCFYMDFTWLPGEDLFTYLSFLQMQYLIPFSCRRRLIVCLLLHACSIWDLYDRRQFIGTHIVRWIFWLIDAETKVLDASHLETHMFFVLEFVLFNLYLDMIVLGFCKGQEGAQREYNLGSRDQDEEEELEHEHEE